MNGRAFLLYANTTVRPWERGTFLFGLAFGRSVFDARFFLLSVLSVGVSSSETVDNGDSCRKEGPGSPGVCGAKGDDWVSIELSNSGVSRSPGLITGLGRDVGVNGEPRVAPLSLREGSGEPGRDVKVCPTPP